MILSSIKQNNYYLSQLLPDKSTSKLKVNLKEGLLEYSVLLKATELACQALKQGESERFDALVGDTACEKRAIRIALTVKKCLMRIDKIESKVRNASEIIKNFLQSNDSIKSEESLNVFLEKVKVKLTEDELFLIQCYILAITKEVRDAKLTAPLLRNEACVEKKLACLGETSRTFKAKLIKNLRSEISRASVEFMQKLAVGLGDGELIKMVSNEFIVVDQFKRYTIPCFWSFDIMTRQALHDQIPIVMHAWQKASNQQYKIVNELWLFFQVDQSRNYQAARPQVEDLEKEAIIVEGFTCREINQLPNKREWKKLLKQIPVTDLLLASIAAHRQYTNSVNDKLIEDGNHQRFLDYRMKGHAWGCSLDNPSLFLASHVFWARAKHIKPLELKANRLKCPDA